MRASRVHRVVAVAGRGMGSGAVLAWFACLLSSGTLACDPSTRALGEACLKDVDCQSGVCSDRTCAAAPTYGPLPAPDDAAGNDASLEVDATADGSLADAEPGVDAASSDARDDGGPPDATPDGEGGAALDAGPLPQDGAPQNAPREG